MVDVLILAKYIVLKMAEKGKKISHLKLQKLLYYVQAWHLVYADAPLFEDEFEAWLHGPVIRKVWNHYKVFSTMLDFLPVSQDVKIDLTEDQIELIDDVLDEYGDKTGYYLECLTHAEDPWKNARNNGKENAIITKNSMKDFYGKLLDVKA